MRIISINVGQPREVRWKGRTVLTGIFKDPVTGRLLMRTLNLDGDRQADLSVHGGPSKAVYVYPAEHYAYWREALPGTSLPWGMFGENLSTEGLREEEVNIGDRFRIGGAEVMVTEPRVPCYKLALKFGRDDMLKRFLQSGRTGFYLAVLREGEVGAGDAVELIGRDAGGVTVADVARLYTHERGNQELARRALQVEALSEVWRSFLQDRLDQEKAR